MAPRKHRRKIKSQPRTLVAIVRDRSYSMYNRVHATISGTQEYVNTLKSQAEGEVLVYLVEFNGQISERFTAKPIEDISNYDLTNYHPSGYTALLDAVGHTINKLESEERSDDRVSFVIMTDGLENASRRFGRSQIRDMIFEREADGWEFSYLGAGSSAWQGGDMLGLRNDQTIYYGDDARSHRSAIGDIAVASASVTRQARGSGASYTYLAHSGTKSNLESLAGSRPNPTVNPTVGATATPNSSVGIGGNAPDSLRKRAQRQLRDKHGRFIRS